LFFLLTEITKNNTTKVNNLPSDLKNSFLSPPKSGLSLSQWLSLLYTSFIRIEIPYILTNKIKLPLGSQ